MKIEQIKTSYDEREIILGALYVYERYLRTGKVICTYGKSPITAKRTAKLDKKIRNIHFKARST